MRCSPLFQRYDDYDLAAALTPGDNVIAVLVHTYGRDTAFYETTKGMWQPTFGDGGLWTEGEAATGAGAVDLLDPATAGGASSRIAWTQDTPQSNHSLGFIEDFDAARLPTGWTEPGFDDRGWDDARPLLAGGGGPEVDLRRHGDPAVPDPAAARHPDAGGAQGRRPSGSSGSAA